MFCCNFENVNKMYKIMNYIKMKINVSIISMLFIINLCIYGLYLYIYKYVFLFRKKLNKFFFVYCKVC